MSKEKYKGEWTSEEVNFWQNKKMQNFHPGKKRKLITDNIIRMKAINKFINISLFPIINRPYKNGKKTLDFLTAAEKLDYLQKFCINTVLRNNDIMKAIKEELVKTHVSGVSND